MKWTFRVMDTQLGLVQVRETEERFYVTVGRRDLTINKNKREEIEGSGTYVSEEPLPWELEHKKLLEEIAKA